MEIFDPQFADKTPNGEMNFIGAVKTYFDLFTKNCNEHTKDTYIRDYNERIFPLISPALAMKEYSAETIDFYRDRIQTQYQYDDTTMRSRYDHLLLDPCEIFFEMFGDHNNPLWGAAFKFFSSEDEESKQAKLLRVRKSLSIQEELNAKLHLLTLPQTDNGALIALAVMFLAALRNAEACGLNFRDLIEFKEHPGRYYIRVYETTKRDSNRLKMGGKTYNAPRFTPIPKVLSDFLLRRKEYIESVVTFPYTDEEGTVYESIDAFPMACRKNRFAVRCSAKDLTDAGRELLRSRLKMDEEHVSGLSVLALDDTENLAEKDPTTYLFRRNMATHLYALGFSQLQIQYYMGHRLEDSDLKRSDFTDEELLYEMSVLLDAHPLNGTFGCCRELHNAENETVWENIPKVEVKVPPQSTEKTYYVKIAGRELCDPIKVNVVGQDCTVECFVTVSNQSKQQDNEVNVTKQVCAVYAQEERKEKINPISIIEKGVTEMAGRAEVYDLTRNEWRLISAKPLVEADRAREYRCRSCKAPAHLAICKQKDNYFYSEMHDMDCSISKGHKTININASTEIDYTAILNFEDSDPVVQDLKNNIENDVNEIAEDDEKNLDRRINPNAVRKIRSASGMYAALCEKRGSDYLDDKTSIEIDAIFLRADTIRKFKMEWGKAEKLVVTKRCVPKNLKYPIQVPRGAVVLRDAYSRNDEDAIYFIVQMRHPWYEQNFKRKLFGETVRDEHGEVRRGVGRDRHKHIAMFAKWKRVPHKQYTIYCAEQALNSRQVAFVNAMDAI